METFKSPSIMDSLIAHGVSMKCRCRYGADSERPFTIPTAEVESQSYGHIGEGDRLTQNYTSVG
jgi:hypothetical protein